MEVSLDDKHKFEVDLKINEASKEEQLQLLEIMPSLIKEIENQDKELQEKALEYGGLNVLEYIEYLDKDLQYNIIDKVPQNAIYIRNLDNDVKIKAFEELGFNRSYLDNPTEEMQREIVSKYYYLIKFIDDPTEAIQEAAIKRNPLYIQFIKSPSEKMQLKAIELGKFKKSVIYECKKFPEFQNYWPKLEREAAFKRLSRWSKGR